LTEAAQSPDAAVDVLVFVLVAELAFAFVTVEFEFAGGLAQPDKRSDPASTGRVIAIKNSLGILDRAIPVIRSPSNSAF
jgi:hypothetical protein